jgi:hypothetical protein
VSPFKRPPTKRYSKVIDAFPWFVIVNVAVIVCPTVYGCDVGNVNKVIIGAAFPIFERGSW